MIDDSRARKLASDLKRCTYYETCATYGLNVERVFQDGKLMWSPPYLLDILYFLACQKIVQQRMSSSTLCSTPTSSRPSTPNNHYNSISLQRQLSQGNNGYAQLGQQHVSMYNHGGLVLKVRFSQNSLFTDSQVVDFSSFQCLLLLVGSP